MAVLWALMLLAMIAGSFSVSTRTQAHLARNIVERSKAEALAEAGVQRAIVGLLASAELGGVAVDGTIYAWRFDDSDVVFMVDDEGAKIDVNAASAEILAALLAAVGLDQTNVTAIAEAIVDYRDEDDERLPMGAEAKEYRSAGRASGPKNRPFELVDELQSVLGVSPEVYALIAPVITVYTGNAEPPAELAADPVRQALALGQRQSTVDRRRTDRSRPAADGMRGQSPLAAGEPQPVPARDLVALTPERTFFRSENRIYRIRVQARSEGGGLFVRDAVVGINTGIRPPFNFYAWRQGRRFLVPNGSPEFER